jgi:hypothetical protein
MKMEKVKSAALLIIAFLPPNGDDGDSFLRRTGAMFVSTTPTRDTP